MTTRTGLIGDDHGLPELAKIHHSMLAVAAIASGGTGRTEFHALTMHTGLEGLTSFLVALPASTRDVSLMHPGIRFLRSQDGVAFMAIRTGGGSLVASQHGLCVGTTRIRLRRVRYCGVVAPANAILIAVASCTDRSEIRPVQRAGGIVGGQIGVWIVTTRAGGCQFVAPGKALAMRTTAISLDDFLMAIGAFGGRQLRLVV